MTTVHGISMSVPVIHTEDDAMEISSEAGRKLAGEDVDIDLESGDGYDENGGDDYMIDDANWIADEDIVGNGEHQATNDDEMLDEVQYTHEEGGIAYDEDLVDAEEDSDTTAIAGTLNGVVNTIPSANNRDQQFPQTYLSVIATEFTAINEQNPSAEYTSYEAETHAQQPDDPSNTYQFAGGPDDIIDYEEDPEISLRTNVDEKTQNHQHDGSASAVPLKVDGVSTDEKVVADNREAVSEAVSRESHGIAPNEKGLDTVPDLVDNDGQEASGLVNLGLSDDHLTQAPAESHFLSTDNRISDPIDGKVVNALLDHSELVVAPADHPIVSAQSTSQQPPILHPVIVMYQDSEISLFPPDEDGPEPSQTYFLEDSSVANHNLLELMMALRTILGDTIAEQDELYFKIEQLGLEFSESTLESSTTSLKQMLDLYLRFEHNDGVTQPLPLNVQLTLKEKFAARLEYLHNAASEGRSLTHLDRFQGATEAYGEDDGDDGEFKYEGKDLEVVNDHNYGKVTTEAQHNENSNIEFGDTDKYEEENSEQLHSQTSTDTHDVSKEGQEYPEDDGDGGYEEDQGLHVPDEEDDYDEESGKYDDEEEYDQEEHQNSQYGEGDYTDSREDFDKSLVHGTARGSRQHDSTYDQDNLNPEFRTVDSHSEELEHGEFNPIKDSDYIDYDEDERAHDMSAVSSTLQGDDPNDSNLRTEADGSHVDKASTEAAEYNAASYQNGFSSNLAGQRQDYSHTSGPLTGNVEHVKTPRDLTDNAGTIGENDDASAVPNPEEPQYHEKERYDDDEITYEEDEEDALDDDKHSQEHTSINKPVLDSPTLKRSRIDNEEEIDFEEDVQDIKRIRSD